MSQLRQTERHATPLPHNGTASLVSKVCQAAVTPCPSYLVSARRLYLPGSPKSGLSERVTACKAMGPTERALAQWRSRKLQRLPCPLAFDRSRDYAASPPHTSGFLSARVPSCAFFQAGSLLSNAGVSPLTLAKTRAALEEAGTEKAVLLTDVKRLREQLADVSGRLHSSQGHNERLIREFAALQARLLPVRCAERGGIPLRSLLQLQPPSSRSEMLALNEPPPAFSAWSARSRSFSERARPAQGRSGSTRRPREAPRRCRSAEPGGGAGAHFPLPHPPPPPTPLPLPPPQQQAQGLRYCVLRVHGTSSCLPAPLLHAQRAW